MADRPPPASFEERMTIPEAGYRTAIAIKHEGRMTDVLVTFVLRQQDGGKAEYAATCPRCHTGEILVAVKLDGNGGFAGTTGVPRIMPCLRGRTRCHS